MHAGAPLVRFIIISFRFPFSTRLLPLRTTNPPPLAVSRQSDMAVASSRDTDHSPITSQDLQSYLLGFGGLRPSHPDLGRPTVPQVRYDWRPKGFRPPFRTTLAHPTFELGHGGASRTPDPREALVPVAFRGPSGSLLKRWRCEQPGEAGRRRDMP